MNGTTNQRPLAQVAAIVLAAGKGTRMRSGQPKVLHRAAGRSLLDWVVRNLAEAGITKTCVVLSEDLEAFQDFLREHPDVCVAVQKNRLGTGDAVAATAWSFAGMKPAPFAAGEAYCGDPIACDHVLICAGDTPAVRPETLRAFVEGTLAAKAAVGVLGMRVPDPKGYGRLIMKDAELTDIVEEKDADPETKRIDVCNSGIFCVEKRALDTLVAELRPENAQGEYYLTDIVRLACERGLKTIAHVTDAWRDFAGINDRRQLAEVERWLVERRLRTLMDAGVTCRMPETLYVEADVEVGPDSEIGPGARLHGRTQIGRACLIGGGVSLRDAAVGDGARIGDGSVIVGVEIQAGESVPPLSVRTP